MDPIIDEMHQQIVNWGHWPVPKATMRRWIDYLKDVVDPQLDELAALKLEKASKARSKVGPA